MSVRNLLRESSEAESEFLDSEHEDTEIPRRIAVPPRGAVLTMRDVRAVRDDRVSFGGRGAHDHGQVDRAVGASS